MLVIRKFLVITPRASRVVPPSAAGHRSALVLASNHSARSSQDRRHG